MRKIIALAGVFALAACGGGEEAEVVEGEEEVAETVIPQSTGTYVGTNEEGEEWTRVLAEDGTYTDTVGGETVETGTWEDTIRGTCLTADTAEGEAAEGEMCYNIGQPAEDGTVEVTGPDGQTITMTKQA